MGKKYAQKFEDTGDSGYIPENGYVPDEETAINIAVAVWKKIYNESAIEKQKPYFAYLVDDLWVFTGSLPKTYAGGTAKAIIDKKSGKILHIMHYK